MGSRDYKPFPRVGGEEVLSSDPGLSGPRLESVQLVRVQLTPSMRTCKEKGMQKLPALPLVQLHPQETDMGGVPTTRQDLLPSH